jgi:hypothetical protein
MTLATEMETYGLTAEDVIDICQEYLKEFIAASDPKSDKLYRPIVVPCPTPGCGHPLEISPVNVSRCTNVGGEWKTSLVCSNPDCRFTELSKKTLEEWGM